MLKNVVFVLCFLLLWSCGHKSNIKYHESGLYVLVEDGDYINLEPRTQPVIEGYGIDEAYRRGMVPSTINKERVVSLKDFLFCESHFESVKELIERMYNKYSNE